MSFANCGLPYYAGGVIDERDALLLQTPRPGRPVRARRPGAPRGRAVDRAGRRVRVRHPDGRRRASALRRARARPGRPPVRPTMPGIERALTAARRRGHRRRGGRRPPARRTAVVVGGGFIGVEVAENLRPRARRRPWSRPGDQVMTPLDPEMAGRCRPIRAARASTCGCGAAGPIGVAGHPDRRRRFAGRPGGPGHRRPPGHRPGPARPAWCSAPAAASSSTTSAAPATPASSRWATPPRRPTP